MIKKKIISLLFFFSFYLGLFAYTTNPTCPDFTDIKASCVVATTGSVSNPFMLEGVVSDRHQLITVQGTDPRTGDLLSLIPSGETQVVKLGNEKVGAEAESLTYHFIVDKDNPILLVKFAVVLQDPQHNHLDQPRFVMRIMDKWGNLIEDCAEYDISSGGEIDGFQREGSVQWRDWTNVGLDMSKLVGQEVQVQFVTYDCKLGAHYGYAYFTAHCISNSLHFSSCEASSFTIEAPEGFAAYLWDNGDNTKSSTGTKTGSPVTLSCNVTSATDCQFTLVAYISDEVGLPTKDTTIVDTICQGDTYTKYNYNLPEQMEIGTHTIYNSILNPSTCVGNVTLILKLTVIQRYTEIKESICIGNNYNKNGFNIIQPPVGMIRDTLFLNSKNAFCDSIVCLDLTVNASFSLPMANAIKGDAYPCVGEIMSYSFDYAGELASFAWTVPDSTIIMSGQGTSQIRLVFQDTVVGNIFLTGENGCGSGSISIPVYPKPSYHSFVADSICLGEYYNKNGFDLGVQDSTGYFVFMHNYQTSLGCDSVNILALSVFPTPILEISSLENDVLCNSESITLYAVTDNKNIEDYLAVPQIAIGDIHCTDGTIVKPKDYWTSGKTADGVVFFVDTAYQHGWILSLTETDSYWGSNFNSPLPDFSQNRYDLALADTAGYANTKILRDASSGYSAAATVDFANDWYLPAIGQLNILYASIHKVNKSLVLLNAIQIPTYENGLIGSGWSYWSSTECTTTYAWSLRDEGCIYPYAQKNTHYIKVRAVRSF